MTRNTGTALVLMTACLAALSPAAAHARDCPAGTIARAGTCTDSRTAARRVVGIAKEAAARTDSRALLVRVDVGGRKLARAALGESLAGVPATPDMHFRAGAEAVALLTTIALQLVDEGKLRLSDRVSRWYPQYPNADRVTIQMLTQSTSGYPDYIQGNPAFVDLLFSDVFRQFRQDELLSIAFAQPVACEPGACFHYAHTNYLILSNILQKVTGRSTASLMRTRVLEPLDLEQTAFSPLPAIPGPALHAYTSDRGFYEDSTYWSPSWAVGRGTIMTSTVDDVATIARAVGTGRLLSKGSHRRQVAPSPVPSPVPSTWFGMGVVVTNGWAIQNPELNGFLGVMGSSPDGTVSIATEATQGLASDADENGSAESFEAIARYFTPDSPPSVP